MVPYWASLGRYKQAAGLAELVELLCVVDIVDSLLIHMYYRNQNISVKCCFVLW